MDTDRRYTDEEVRAIFRESGEGPGPTTSDPGPGGEGLTLAELREIATEVGLDPNRVAEAARALEATGAAALQGAAETPVDVARPSRGGVASLFGLPPSLPGLPAPLPGLPASLTPAKRTRLGAPLAVSEVVDLPRAPTDAEWQILVGELRETFGARGELGGAGSMRDWSNGNLHVAVEPTEAGHRLRMGTLKGSARAMESAGLAMGGAGVLLAALMGLTGEIQGALMLGGMLGGMSAFYLGANTFGLPRWARERHAQFQRIGARAVRLLGEAPEPPRQAPEGRSINEDRPINEDRS
ncbi:MAG TPA: hypothetical protein VK837_03170 [Longimicrobiales bacterium]|nr:hypothetical protein [Longimicrobiales bacterium]